MSKGNKGSLSLIAGGRNAGEGDHLWPLVPGVGIGPFRFGMSPDQARTACEVSGEDRIDEDGDLEIEFESLGIAALFLREDDLRLSLLEVDLVRPCSLWGCVLTGESTRQAVAALIDENCQASAGEKRVVHLGYEETSLAVSDLFLRFYFDQASTLSSISFGVLFGLDDEPSWPSPG